MFSASILLATFFGTACPLVALFGWRGQGIPKETAKRQGRGLLPKRPLTINYQPSAIFCTACHWTVLFPHKPTPIFACRQTVSGMNKNPRCG